ncbi:MULTISPECIES: DUF3854 domain-containing protein [Oscillatoriales]|uniref:Primase P4 n=1 Tax=Phormidium nigroviride PCC 7112 TaxID=179408 RepID=K9VSH8_9CYAN|nr:MULTISPECIES: DUF3854 domain-containing protein [Oscillatoriales]AFZ10519.1 primase P4 [Oscillatoria nigro-viridis PCC 7112]MBE9093303.1 DUF3854 domain-containing protein [Tychonema sp. LEGE 07203]
MNTPQSTQESHELDTAQPTPEHQAHIEADIDRGDVVVAQATPDLSGFGVLCSLNEKFSLTPEHEQKIADRGLLNDWARATCCSISKAQASLAGFSVKSAGILFKGANGQEQLRPDKPRKKSNGDIIKYETKSGEAFDAILPTSPYTPDYWDEANLRKECYHINDVPYLLVTEGGYKAISGCSNGIPTIGLLGVEMGLTGKKSDPEKQRFLIPTLRKYAEAGFGFIIAFDADALTNSNICEAERKLAKQLGKFGVPVRTITGDWAPASVIEGGEVKNTKGMDDFIQHKGIEEFRAILTKAKLFGEKENDEAGERPDKKPPTPRKVAAQIKEDYGHQWKYDNEQKTWRVWNGKCWEKIEIGAFTSLVKTTLDARNINYRGSAYIEDVKKLLEHDLRQVRWLAWDNTQYINFSNCVLEGNKNKALEHSPGMGFISYLPYDYKPLQGDLGDGLEALSVNCPKIYKFFHEAMNADKRKMLKLLAIINALLKRRFFDLQMFVHLIGKPGSGKGKFARLCQKLVGKDNSIGCQLERLIDGSTKASLIDKQLVVFPDERKPVGINSILSLTGGDVISYRELHTPAASAYFYGSLLICSNKPIFIGDTTGLERRLCLVDFDNPVHEDKRDHSLEAELDAEIPALITIALSLLDSAVTQAIRGTGANQIMEFKLKEWEMKIETDSIAAFFDTELVLADSTTTPTSKLYEAYKTWCENSGLKPFSLTKFPRHLSELLTDQRLPAKWCKARTSTFEGLRLRSEHDEHPTYSQSLESLAPLATPLCTTSTPLDAPLENIPSKGLHHLHHLEDKPYQENSNNQFSSPETACNQEAITEIPVQAKENPPPSGASGANSLPANISTGAATGAEVVQDTPSSGAVGSKHKEFKEGDRVVITEVGHLHHGQKGEVICVSYGSRETDYRIKLDKASHNLEVITVAVPKISHAPVLMQLKAEEGTPC